MWPETKMQDFPVVRIGFSPKSTLVTECLEKNRDVLVHTYCKSEEESSFVFSLSFWLHHGSDCSSWLEKVRNSRFGCVFWSKMATLMAESREEWYGSHI